MNRALPGPLSRAVSPGTIRPKMAGKSLHPVPSPALPRQAGPGSIQRPLGLRQRVRCVRAPARAMSRQPLLFVSGGETPLFTNQSPWCAPMTRTERLCRLGNTVASERPPMCSRTQFEAQCGASVHFSGEKSPWNPLDPQILSDTRREGTVALSRFLTLSTAGVSY